MFRAYSPEGFNDPSFDPALQAGWYVDAPLALRKENPLSRISPDG
jgi:hypothetical protein